jgi:hypothetical protein
MALETVGGVVARVWIIDSDGCIYNKKNLTRVLKGGF